MLNLKCKKVTRTYQCDMNGCRNRTNLLWSRRGDLSSKPMHICDECIKGLYEARFGKDEAPEVPDLSPSGGAEFNGGLAAVMAEPIVDEIDTFDPEAIAPKEEEKAAPVKKTAKKGPAGAKTSGKGKTGGKA